MNHLPKYVSTCLFATSALLVGASPAWAQTTPALGAASSFAVLSVGAETPPRTAVDDATAAVTLTSSAVIGNVGSAGAVSLSSSTINGNVVLSGAFVPVLSTYGAIITPLPAQVETDFDNAYAALAAVSCDTILTGTLAGLTLTPGVYCFDAAAALTGTLTLAGGSNDTWLFKIGTSGTGALTGTDFSVVMANGAVACNVYWWVAEAATMTTSDFKGTILAGAAITTTGGTFEGRALAKAAVTLTGAAFLGCEGGTTTHNPPQQRCNQGVGNGPEGCDPGNSNQGNPFRSNDEFGGVPGNPGRKGGNK